MARQVLINDETTLTTGSVRRKNRDSDDHCLYKGKPTLWPTFSLDKQWSVMKCRSNAIVVDKRFQCRM